MITFVHYSESNCTIIGFCENIVKKEIIYQWIYHVHFAYSLITRLSAIYKTCPFSFELMCLTLHTFPCSEKVFFVRKRVCFSYLISPQKPTIYLFNKKIKFDWLRIFEVDVACILFFIRIFLTMSCFLSVENLYHVLINSAYYTIFYNSIYFSENNKRLYIAMHICIW